MSSNCLALLTVRRLNTLSMLRLIENAKFGMGLDSRPIV